MQHIISCLVENNPGVLARISSMFSSRGFNIDSLNVGTTIDPTISRMTIVSTGNDIVIEQIIKQLNKLIDVIEVGDLTEHEHVERELVMFKVSCTKKNRSELIEVAQIYRAKIVDVDTDSLIIEVVGAKGKIDGMFKILKQYDLQQITRTGRVALARGTADSTTQKYGLQHQVD